MLKHTLLYPIKSATGQLITEITVPRPKRGDYKRASRYSQNAIEQEDFVISQLAGITLEDVDELDMADSVVITRYLRGDDTGSGVEDPGRDTAGSAAAATVGD